MARCCSYSNTKISKCGNTSPVHCQIWSVQTCNFFSVGNRTCIVSYSHFRKLHVCILIFLHLFFGSKIREIDHADHAVIPSEMVCLRPYPPQFLKYGHVPRHPLHTMIQQSKIIILCNICTHRLCELNLAASQERLHFAEACALIVVSGGQGRDAGSVTCTCASSGVQEVAFGRLLLLPVTKKGLFFGPKKTRKTRHANTGLPSIVRCFFSGMAANGHMARSFKKVCENSTRREWKVQKLTHINWHSASSGLIWPLRRPTSRWYKCCWVQALTRMSNLCEWSSLLHLLTIVSWPAREGGDCPPTCTKRWYYTYCRPPATGTRRWTRAECIASG